MQTHSSLVHTVRVNSYNYECLSVEQIFVSTRLKPREAILTTKTIPNLLVPNMSSQTIQKL